MKRSFIAVLLLLALVGSLPLWAGAQGEKAATGTTAAVTAKFREGEDLPLRIENLVSKISLPLAAQKVTLKVSQRLVGTPKSDLNGYLNYQEIEKRTNVHVQWQGVDRNEYQKYLDALMAAGSNLPDIVLEIDGMQRVIDWYEGGLVIPLDDLILKHAPDIKYLYDSRPSSRKQMYHADGHIPGLNSIYFDQFALIPWVRQEWLNKLNLPYPKTQEEWEKVFRAFTNDDPNGNGQKDEYAWFIPDPGSLFGLGFGMLFGMGELYSDFVYDAKGNVTYKYLLPQAREAMTFMKKAYQEKWFPTPMVDDPANFKPWPDWYNKPHGLHWGWAGPLDQDWVPMVPPKSTRWTNYIASYPSVRTNYNAITKDAKDPVTAIKWLDYVYANKDGWLLYNKGLEGQHWYKDADNYYYNGTTDWAKLTQQQQTDWSDKFKNEVYRGEGSPNVYPEDQSMPAAGTGRDNYRKTFEMITPFLRAGFPNAIMPIKSERAGVDTWNQNKGGTYVTDMIRKFVSGQEPIENWDQFVAQLKKLGITEYTAAMQSQYNRFLNF